MSDMLKRVARAIYNSNTTVDEYDAEVAARAAIEAMREPTDEMAAATGCAYGPALEDHWRAMIDAALNPRGEA